jgi:4-aminobutyrate aminotransferase-like enzyme
MLKIENLCLENGLIVFTTPGVPVLRFAPPLIIKEAEIDFAVSVLEEAIRSASGTQSSAQSS